MKKYLIIETLNNSKYEFPKIIFYDKNCKKWIEDNFYGNIEIIKQIGKKTKKFGYEVIVYDTKDYIKAKNMF